MKGARPALRYAKAILNLASEKGVDELVNNDMKLIVETIAESSDLQRMLKSPVIKSSEKTKVLNALFSDKVNNITKGLFNLLEENKRMVILETVAKQYSVVYDYKIGSQIATVTTAVALTEEVSSKIQQKIIELTGSEATIESKIDPSIIGGFILRIRDMQYDASVSNQLKQLRKEFDNSQYISQI